MLKSTKYSKIQRIKCYNVLTVTNYYILQSAKCYKVLNATKVSNIENHTMFQSSTFSKNQMLQDTSTKC